MAFNLQLSHSLGCPFEGVRMTSLSPKQIVIRAARYFGYDIVRRIPAPSFPIDFTEKDAADFQRVRPYTLTGSERVLSLIESIRYLTRNCIEGAIVECGVWRGGSMMAAAYALLEEGKRDRDLYLYDTFEGMTDPTDVDIDNWGKSATEYLQPFFAAGLDVVRENLRKTGYPESRIHYIQGKVEDTLPARAPERIALLRLDTDWYESTKHELVHLFPRVVPGGIIIIDDYGHFKGCKRAVDEFVASLGKPVFLNRIDYSGRLIVK